MLPWVMSAPRSAPVLEAMDSMLGAHWTTLVHDDRWRTSNRIAQPLITGISLAAWAALAPLLPAPPTVVAGYSVGELSAFASAGVFDAREAIALADRRARLMDSAVSDRRTGMTSVSGASAQYIESACSDLSIEPAIRISPLHHIYAGLSSDLRAMEMRLRGVASCKRLCVQVASHSSLMSRAADEFSALLEDVGFSPPVCPIAVNSGGVTSTDPIRLRQSLGDQLHHTVDWMGCMLSIAERGVRCVLEVGPGRALARMWCEQHPEIPARSLEDFANADGAAAWLRRHAVAR
jgi:[acyl-carrier-protein] S-malonyltransferase